MPLFRFESQGSIMGINCPPSHFKKTNPTRIFLLGFIVAVVCFSKVQLGDGPLTAAVSQLVGDALAVALQLGEVLVEDFA